MRQSVGRSLLAASFVSFTSKILKTIRAAMACSLRVPYAATIFCRNGVDDECTRAMVLYD